MIFLIIEALYHTICKKPIVKFSIRCIQLGHWNQSIIEDFKGNFVKGHFTVIFHSIHIPSHRFVHQNKVLVSSSVIFLSLYMKTRFPHSFFAELIFLFIFVASDWLFLALMQRRLGMQLQKLFLFVYWMEKLFFFVPAVMHIQERLCWVK